MKRTRGLTLVEVMVGLLLVAGAVVVLLFAMAENARQRRWARTRRCRSNLNQLARGMAVYLNEFGDNRFYPWPAGRPSCGGTGAEADFGGAEWLATLYWTGIFPDPGIYICPGTLDTNENGRLLGRRGCSGPGFQGGADGKLRPDAVSYAAMAATSVAVYQWEVLGMTRDARWPHNKIAIRDDFPPNEPMASDDTEGEINHFRAHNGCMGVLFFDSHVEFWTHEKIDLERGVGMQGGELVILRN